MMRNNPVQHTDFFAVWNRFVRHGDVKDVPVHIRQSWQRCREASVDPRREPALVGIDQKTLDERINERLDLYQLLQAHSKNIEKYFDFLPLAIMFADTDGFVLATTGDYKIIKMMGEPLHAEMVGGSIKEFAVGTSAPGICLEEKRFAAVHAEEHYIRHIHWASCVATPIFENEQNLLGCLDFTVHACDGEKLRYLIPLLLNTAKSIQFELSLKNRLERHDLFYSYYRSTFEYSMSMLILVGGQGEIIDLNRTAQEVLKISPEMVRNQDIGSIFHDRNKIISIMKPSGGRILLGGKNPEMLSVESIPLTDRRGMEVAFLLKLEKEKGCKRVAESPANTARHTFANILGTHPAITDVIKKAKKAARTGSNVLIEGETGTGKELFAHALHNESPYHSGPFVAVNCSAIPRELIESELFGYEKGAYTGALRDGNPGKFELADMGTIFLDEIHTMDTTTQVKILRVLEDRQVTRIGGKYPIPLRVRIIAASSEKLDERVAKGCFVAPLFFRLNVVRLSIASLRERKEDIFILVESYIEEMNRKFRRSIRGVDSEALKKMLQYSWPGNVRELKNCIERAFNFCTGDMIRLNDLFDSFPTVLEQKTSIGETIDDMTRNLMIESLRRSSNVEDAANSVGMPVRTFYRKMKAFGIRQTKRMDMDGL